MVAKACYASYAAIAEVTLREPWKTCQTLFFYQLIKVMSKAWGTTYKCLTAVTALGGKRNRFNYPTEGAA